MWLTLIGFLVTLWSLSLVIWLLWKLIRPGDEVHRPPGVPTDRQ